MLRVWGSEGNGAGNIGARQHVVSVTWELGSAPFVVRSGSVLPKPIISGVSELSRGVSLDETPLQLLPSPLSTEPGELDILIVKGVSVRLV